MLNIFNFIVLIALVVDVYAVFLARAEIWWGYPANFPLAHRGAAYYRARSLRKLFDTQIPLSCAYGFLLMIAVNIRIFAPMPVTLWINLALLGGLLGLRLMLWYLRKIYQRRDDATWLAQGRARDAARGVV